MAKTIKFNLILDGNPVRDIDDLRDNFSIEDILEVYRNGLLQRWLNVRGYHDYLKKVDEINSDSVKNIIKELIKIFNIEVDDKNIEEGIAILDYIYERKLKLDGYVKNNFEVKKIISDYHSGYYSIIKDIFENKDNMPRIKADIKEIEKNYMELFNINFRDLYNKFITNAPLAIFAIIMNEKMRGYFIKDDKSSNDTINIYNKILSFIEYTDNLKQKLGKELKVFKGTTEDYWKDIEPKNRKMLIIDMEFGNYIRNSGAFGEEFSAYDINGKFMILDGIDYKSKDANDELLYMEV